MGKLSSLAQETTATINDFIVKVKASGAGDVIVKISDFFNAITAQQAWSPTVVGFGSTTRAQYEYTQLGKIVIISVDVEGTSNSTSFSITLPVAANTNDSYYVVAIPYAQDNGSVLSTPRAEIATGTSTTLLNLYSTMAGGGWTASGTKIARFTMTYIAA